MSAPHQCLHARLTLCRALELVRRRDLPIVALFTPPQSRSPCHLPASSPAATAHCSHSPPSSSSHARQQTPLTLLSTATASASTPPFHLLREPQKRAATVKIASTRNSCHRLNHSQIPLTTSSSGQPRTHFSFVPSL